METFEIKFDTVIYRFMLMMGIVIVAFAIELPLLAFLAFPVFMSALMGAKFKSLRDVNVRIPKMINTESTVLKEVYS